jgi:hypothetical protein
MELEELGFCNKKHRFEGAQKVLDLYNKTFKKIPPVEAKMTILKIEITSQPSIIGQANRARFFPN